MPKMTYEIALGPWNEPGDFYDDDGGFTTISKTSAVWFDSDTSHTVALKGEKLKFVEGVLVSGTIEKLTFKDVEGVTLATMSGTFDAEKFGPLFGADEIATIIEKALKGDDKIIGTSIDDSLRGYKGDDILLGGGGSDILSGGPGKDRLTGGAGSDYFTYDGPLDLHPGDGAAVITDFDAVGGGTNQDYISSEADVLEIRKSGKNTVIEFADGGTLTLLDVKASQVTDADFDFPAV